MKDTWREYIETTSPNQRRVLQITNPWLNRLDTAMNDVKQQYREANPEVDAALVYWEYSTRPRTTEGVQGFQQSVGVP